jgi:HSP20 family protein
MTSTSLQNKDVRGDLPTAETVQSNYFTPRVDILENDNELTLFADMPGVRPDDVDIRFERGELTLQGRCLPRQQSGSLLLAEYGVGDFYRSFTINPDIDTSRISAEMKNGVLTVHLPKSEAVKPRRITVKGS